MMSYFWQRFSLITLGLYLYLSCRSSSETIVIDRTVVLGDSLFWSGPLFYGGQPSPLVVRLEKSLGYTLETHAAVGASLEEGWVKSIREQYDALDKEHPSPISILVMDGGGNDVISHRRVCEEGTAECDSTLQTVGRIALSIMEDAGRVGIPAIVYLGVYDLPRLEKTVEKGNTLIRGLCEGVNITRCCFVDPRFNATTGMGIMIPDMIGPDGVHPTQEGYERLADVIYARGQECMIF